MEIFPAIDLKDSKVVRLSQGDYDKVDVFSTNPLDVAKGFQKDGAKNLHVVDLDGARDGELSNFDVIKNIIKNTSMFVQVGGGIRDKDRIQKYVDIGVGRVILGTIAAQSPDFVEEMVKKFGDKIAVGVDAKDGRVAVKGWTEVTDIDSIEFCKKMQDIGVKTIIYTDIAKDGMMSGTNMDIYKELAEKLSLDIVASGGITSADEIPKLKEIGTYGAIIGKALYLGDISLKEVL